MAKQAGRSVGHGADKSMFGWVSGVAGRVGVDRMGSYLGVDRMSGVLGDALQGAARTKARVDRNIEVLLALANLPSRRDYQSLKTKLDSLQGALMNLNRKLDHLTRDLGAQTGARANGRARATASARSRAAKTSSRAKKPASRSRATARKKGSRSSRSKSAR